MCILKSMIIQWVDWPWWQCNAFAWLSLLYDCVHTPQFSSALCVYTNHCCFHWNKKSKAVTKITAYCFLSWVAHARCYGVLHSFPRFHSPLCWVVITVYILKTCVCHFEQILSTPILTFFECLAMLSINRHAAVHRPLYI